MTALMELFKSVMGKFFTNSSAKTAKTKKQEEETSDTSNEISVVNYELENREPRRDFIEPVLFKNNNPRLMKELAELSDKNQKLFSLVSALNQYTNKQFKKPILLTMIERTQAEQDYLYRDSAKYQKKKFLSPHQLSHAVDIRSHSFTLTEIRQVESWINSRYNNKNYYKWTAKYHKVGNNGFHFHIQFIDKNL